MPRKPVPLSFDLDTPQKAPGRRSGLFSSEFEAKVYRSAPGQAGFAGEGPKGTFCMDCAHFRSKGAYAGARIGDLPKPGPCRKFKEMTRNKGASIPPRTRSCKYFEDK